MNDMFIHSINKIRIKIFKFFLIRLLRKDVESDEYRGWMNKQVKLIYKKLLIQNEEHFGVEANWKYVDSRKLNVWFCWFQGKDNMPPIVNACFNSIRFNFPENRNNVHLITEKNMINYVKFPNDIMEMIRRGRIDSTKATNLLRFALIYLYGGVWIDATVLVTGNIEEELINHKFYTNKRYFPRKGNISKGRWTTYFIKDEIGSYIAKKLLDYHLLYWRVYREMIDYWFFDYLLSCMYDEDEIIKKTIESVPYNNIGNWKLKDSLNDEYDRKKYSKILEESKIHKLSHKEKFSLEINGNKTFYGKILEEWS